MYKRQAQELYLAALIDRGQRRPMIMASAAGGMDIEEGDRQVRCWLYDDAIKMARLQQEVGA